MNTMALLNPSPGHDYLSPGFDYGTLHCSCNTGRRLMKSATIPPLRVIPELRAAAESVLKQDESLSAFVESALRKQIERRKLEHEFIARGLAARDESRRTDRYVSKDDSLAALDTILTEHRDPK